MAVKPDGAAQAALVRLTVDVVTSEDIESVELEAKPKQAPGIEVAFLVVALLVLARRR